MELRQWATEMSLGRKKKKKKERMGIWGRRAERGVAPVITLWKQERARTLLTASAEVGDEREGLYDSATTATTTTQNGVHCYGRRRRCCSASLMTANEVSH